jgi:hypothetical protein
MFAEQCKFCFVSALIYSVALFDLLQTLRPQFRYAIPQDMLPPSDRIGLAPSYMNDSGGGGGNGVPMTYHYLGGVPPARYANPASAAAYGGYVSPVCLC